MEEDGPDGAGGPPVIWWRVALHIALCLSAALLVRSVLDHTGVLRPLGQGADLIRAALALLAAIGLSLWLRRALPVWPD